VSAGILVVYRTWRIQLPWKTLTRALVVAPVAYLIASAWATGGAWIFVKLLLIGLGIVLSFVVLGEFSAPEIALARSWWDDRTIRKDRLVETK
jgi:hypothetical protein